jgi:hypothetical protein
MQEKKQTLLEKHTVDTSKRNGIWDRLSVSVVPQREKLLVDGVTKPEMKPDPKLLLAELEGDVDNSLYNRWATVIKSKAESIQDATSQLKDSTNELRRVANGYQSKFGFRVET